MRKNPQSGCKDRGFSSPQDLEQAFECGMHRLAADIFAGTFEKEFFRNASKASKGSDSIDFEFPASTGQAKARESATEIPAPENPHFSICDMKEGR